MDKTYSSVKFERKGVDGKWYEMRPEILVDMLCDTSATALDFLMMVTKGVERDEWRMVAGE